MSFFGKHLRAFVAVTVAAIPIVVVPILNSGTAQAAGASGTPIKIGMMADDPDPSTDYFQSIPVAEDFVNNWNKHGGFKGHPIQLIIKDVSPDATTTISDAQQLVNNEGVVAMVGNTALLDCIVNASLYTSAGVPIIPGGASSTCKETTGAYTDPYETTGSLSIALKWAIQHGSKKFALVYPNIGGLSFASLFDPMEAYLAKSGSKTKMITLGVASNATAADWDAAIATLKGDGVDTVVALATAPSTAVGLAQADQNSFGPKNGIHWILGPSAYVPSVISPVTEGVYVLSWTYPWFTNAPSVKTALSILKNIKNPDGVTGLIYQDFALFKSVLNEVKGPVTRQSILAAIRKNTPIQLGLSPYKVDLASKDNPEGGELLLLKGGKFQAASSYLTVKLPQSS